MTKVKMGYISCKDLDGLAEVLVDNNMSELVSHHIDGAEEPEVWVELNTEALNGLVEFGFVSQTEADEIIKDEIDTILFY